MVSPMRYAAYKGRFLNDNDSNGTQRDHGKVEKEIAENSTANIKEPAHHSRIRILKPETI